MGRLESAWIGLVFAGGCVFSVVFFAPLLWSRRTFTLGVLALIGVPLALRAAGFLDALAWPILGHRIVLGAGGVVLLSCCAVFLRTRRDADAALLVLWILGTVVFATFVNWSNNGRSNLPLAPAAGILVIASLEQRGRTWSATKTWFAVAPGVLLAVLVAYGDYRWANGVRGAAQRLAASYASESTNAYFQGHWGFQWYMETHGFRPLDVKRTELQRGDLLIAPLGNTGVILPPRAPATELIERLTGTRTWGFHTVDGWLGANFYASNLGALPFAFGLGRADSYRVWRIRRRFRFTGRRDRGR